MAESEDPSLQARVAELEAQLVALRREVDGLREQVAGRDPDAAPAPEPVQVPVPPARKPQPRLRPSVKAEERDTTERIRKVLKTEDWLNKIGIGLLLFGLAFLFKYSIDQGWLGPAVRIGFGAALGLFLLVAGLRLRPKRKAFGQVLLGGSIATFYVTIFAAFQLYSLLSYPVAFGAMGVVTLVAFGMAVQQNDAVLAVVATLGGLGTPFLLYTGAGNVPGLVVYTCAVLACAMGVFLYRGWRSLFVTAVVGGWLVFGIGWAELVFDDHPLADKVVFLLGVGFCWLAFGVLPVLRAIWHRRHPDRWPLPALRFFKERSFAEEPAIIPAFIAPLMSWLLTVEVLDLAEPAMGVLLVGVALAYAVASGALRRKTLLRLASTLAVAAAVLVALACFYLLETASLRLVALAVEGAVLHWVARTLSDRSLRFAAHVLFGGLALTVAARLLEQDGSTPVLVHGAAVADIATLALGFTAAWTLRSEQLRTFYLLVAYLGLLGWFWRDLVALPNGQAYVSVAWGLCAIGLLALGWWRDADLPRNAGLVTLFVVVGKLFVVDLAKLEAIWRILLFLGFGGLLLLLSYFFPSLWRPSAGRNAADDA